MPARLISYKEELTLAQNGYKAIAGVDEVGVGPLAGPVVASAVRLPLGLDLTLLDDSKKLSSMQRARAAEWILEVADDVGYGLATVEEINRLGIRPANLLACRRAVEHLARVDAVIVDAWTIPGLTVVQRSLIKADACVASVAAASILAKVHRDHLMDVMDLAHPQYGFRTHKGYGTRAHMEAIRLHGPCPEHRTSWGVFETLCGTGGDRRGPS